MKKHIAKYFAALFAALVFVPVFALSITDISFAGENSAVYSLLKESGSVGKDGTVKAVAVPAAVAVDSAVEEDKSVSVDTRESYNGDFASVKPGSKFNPTLDEPARSEAVMQVITNVYNDVDGSYHHDGTTFGNKEGRLPKQPMGYYKEYTVIVKGRPNNAYQITIGGKPYTAGPCLSKRGPERLIMGAKGELYFTPDHYANFVRLVVVP